MEDKSLKATQNVPEILIKSLTEYATTLESVLNRFGLSVYSYSVWVEYLNCIKCFTADENQVRYNIEVLKRVCSVVPLKNSDLNQKLTALKSDEKIQQRELLLQYCDDFDVAMELLKVEKPADALNQLVRMESQLLDIENIQQ